MINAFLCVNSKLQFVKLCKKVCRNSWAGLKRLPQKFFDQKQGTLARAIIVLKSSHAKVIGRAQRAKRVTNKDTARSSSN